MGLSRREFYDLTPIDFNYACDKFLEEKESNMKIAYDCMRLQTLYLINIQLASENKITDPRELMHFYWDEEITISEEKLVTREELDDIQNDIYKIFQN